MADTEALQSLRTGKYTSSNSCWDSNSRFFLRLSLHAAVASLLIIILLQVILFSVFYHKIDDKTPIIITPYSTISPETDSLLPCVFLRQEDALPGSKLCPTGGNCPFGYSCSIVADEDTQENTYVCLNDALPCGDLHYCTTYITGLPDTNNSTLPAKLSDVGISETYYLLSVIPTFFCLFLLSFMWLVFNLWNSMLQDPFEPTPTQDNTGILLTIREKYDKMVPAEVTNWCQCRINILVMLPLFLILLISGVIFLSATSPSLHELTLVATADCFENHWLYLFASTMLGWITGFFVVEMICVMAVLFFLSLYTVKPMYNGIWDPRVFLTVIMLIMIIVSIGVTIELISVLIYAV